MGLPLQKTLLEDNRTHISRPITRRSSITNALTKSLRYPTLIGENWTQLPQSIQNRFIKWRPNRNVTLYQGRLIETRFSHIGRILSMLSGLIGRPLPKLDVSRGPATVIVRETAGYEGQVWTRIYPRGNLPPQVIQTTKRFSGTTGLEEMITTNIGIGLRVIVTDGQMVFRSENYFLQLLGRKIYLPKVITPAMTITHKENGPKKFRFTLELYHPLFGELIYQTALFEEIEHD